MPVSLPGSCRCLGSAQPEILIQDMHRTGFSTGSAKGDRDRKKPRGQEGSRPVVVGGGPAQTPLVPAGSTVSPSSSGASLARAQTLLLTLIRPFELCMDPAPPPPHPAACPPSLRYVGPARGNTWLDTAPPGPVSDSPHPLSPTILEAPEVGGRGREPTGRSGGQPGWRGWAGESPQRLFPFISPPQRAWPPQPHPSCSCGSPQAALCQDGVRGPDQRPLPRLPRAPSTTGPQSAPLPPAGFPLLPDPYVSSNGLLPASPSPRHPLGFRVPLWPHSA